MPWDSLKSIMPKAMQAAGIKEKLTSVRVLHAAHKILYARWGKEKAELVNFVSFNSGNLKVTCNSASAMQMLRMEQLAFINDLNRELDGKVVFKIDIRSQGF